MKRLEDHSLKLMGSFVSQNFFGTSGRSKGTVVAGHILSQQVVETADIGTIPGPVHELLMVGMDVDITSRCPLEFPRPESFDEDLVVGSIQRLHHIRVITSVLLGRVAVDHVMGRDDGLDRRPIPAA